MLVSHNHVLKCLLPMEIILTSKRPNGVLEQLRNFRQHTTNGILFLFFRIFTQHLSNFVTFDHMVEKLLHDI